MTDKGIVTELNRKKANKHANKRPILKEAQHFNQFYINRISRITTKVLSHKMRIQFPRFILYVGNKSLTHAAKHHFYSVKNSSILSKLCIYVVEMDIMTSECKSYMTESLGKML